MRGAGGAGSVREREGFPHAGGWAEGVCADERGLQRQRWLVRGAAVSIGANIAEGCGRDSEAEMRHSWQIGMGWA
ncbi:MAG: four helix bundle protein [Terriglobales bacterium]